MPKKSSQKNTQESSASVVSEQTQPVVQPTTTVTQSTTAQPVQPKRKRNTASSATSDATSAQTGTVSQSESTVDSQTESSSKNRVAPTRESVQSEFDSLVALIDEEVARLRSNSTKSKGVKFLRSINKRLKTLRNHALRVSRQKQSTKRVNSNSGFLKPVQISKDLAKFTGWDVAQPRSRVDVTKFICDYIKTHNLQDPEDKRKIKVENDQNLKKLLRFDAKDGKPLTYYSLQTYLKSHFPSS